MSGERIRYGRDALAFVEKLDKLQTVDAVKHALSLEFARYGYTAYLITCHRHGIEQRFERAALLSTWPEEWVRTYIERRYYSHDPVVRHSFRSTEPFAWSDAPYDPKEEPKAREVMHVAAELGLRQGICIPMHGPLGYEAGVSLGGPDLDLTPPAKFAVQLMAVYARDRVNRILSPGRHAAPSLSKREKEVIYWASHGKTAWETSRILNISEPTVNKFTRLACRKLDASNKHHAIAQAFRKRAIN